MVVILGLIALSGTADEGLRGPEVAGISTTTADGPDTSTVSSRALLGTTAASVPDGRSVTISPACLADMKAASFVDHNPASLVPTFTSCTTLAEWRAAAVETGEAERTDADLWVRTACRNDRTVRASPLCRSVS